MAQPVTMRVMIVAGEPSGDLHGSGLVRELKRRSPGCEIFGIGGDKMRAAGMDLVYHIRELSVMGFLEVIQHLPLLRSIERTLEAIVKARRPSVLVLIDYPGFNLRFARVARKLGMKIVYYISPQVWAWNPGRVKKMKGLIDKMLVVFPFEVELYRAEGIDVEFVGHPLLDVFTEPQGRPEFCKRYGFDPGKKIVGLAPGSRRQEIERMFPVMLGAARILHRELGVQLAVAVSSVLELDFLKSFLRDDLPVELIRDATYDVMKNSDLVLVTSGTATLETAYYGTPMIVVYKTSILTYLIVRLLIRIRNIGLVNIVAGEQVVPELLQGRANAPLLAQKAASLLQDSRLLNDISRRLGAVREKLGTPGASGRAAAAILSVASQAG
jgi:lipid-A-disaccharide synthase